MSKRNYILAGIVFLVFAALCYAYIMYFVVQYGDTLQLLDRKILPLFGAACMFATLLGLGEGMFLRAGVVPKWLRLLFYFQWVTWGSAIIITAICILCVSHLV